MDHHLEMHMNSIPVGRQAEATCTDPTMEKVTRAYESLQANARLCSQVLDERPSRDRTLLDIHVAACIDLNKLRDAYRGLVATSDADE